MHDHEIFHLSEFDRRSFLQIAGLATGVGLLTSLAETRASAALPAAKLPGFSAFAKSVKVFKSDKYYLVESDGIPAHQMMVGIKSWQQQVPTVQPLRYSQSSGSAMQNSYLFPMHISPYRRLASSLSIPKW